MSLQASNWILFNWLESNRGALGLKVERIEEFKKQLSGFVQLSIRLGARFQKAAGYSFSSSVFESFTVAGAEALERFALHRCGYENSNGMAVHTNPDTAALHARLELLERDAFMCHYLTATPFFPLKKIRLRSIDGQLLELERYLERKKVTIRFFKMATAAKVDAVLCVVDGRKTLRPFGLKIGAGVSIKSVEFAIRQAFFECLGGLDSALRAKKMKTLSVEGFSKKKFWNASDHRSLSLNLDYANRFEAIYLNRGRPEANLKKRFFSKKRPMPLERIKVQRLKMKDFLPKDCPLTFIRASSLNLHPLFFGPTRVTCLNGSRLSEFRSILKSKEPKGPLVSKAFLLPHPFP